MKVLGIDIDSTKMARKLRAITKHANELADELEAIDNEWQCECGSYDYSDFYTDRFVKRVCDKCNERYAIPKDEELPRPEGSA